MAQATLKQPQQAGFEKVAPCGDRIVTGPTQRARLLIVDGHAYSYRAFHAIRRLTSPTGQPTNAIFGFIKMLAKLRETVQPSHIAVVWDGGLSEERTRALPEYKAQRPPMPAELAEQLDQIIHYLDAAGIPSFREAGVEADDYIACIAKRAASCGLQVFIASSDKDFMQLVSPQIMVINPSDKSQTPWTAERVRAETGVGPGQIVDWLSLTGDSSDNIPGVPGVGPKTAAELLDRFGSVKALFERLPEVRPDKIRTALESARDLVMRNQQLVRLKDDLPVKFDIDQLLPRPPDNNRLRQLFLLWGFRSMLAELDPQEPVATNQTMLL